MKFVTVLAFITIVIGSTLGNPTEKSKGILGNEGNILACATKIIKPFVNGLLNFEEKKPTSVPIIYQTSVESTVAKELKCGLIAIFKFGLCVLENKVQLNKDVETEEFDRVGEQSFELLKGIMKSQGLNLDI